MPYKDPENRKKHHQEYQKTHAKRLNKQKRKRSHEVKYEVMKEFSKRQSNSNVPCCACCKESMLKFLTLDHIEGRKKMGHSKRDVGYKLQRWARENDYPDTLQVLCYNCNMAKGLFGKCPHQKLN